jgi:hypothetical protein
MNAVSAYLREQATEHRAAFAERPDDPRPLRSAEALEALARYAEAGAERGIFQMRYLLEHHVPDGRFAWPEGQSGRSIRHFGFDVPVTGEDELDQFLMDLCDLAKSDAARHIGTNEQEFDRADALAIAERFGLSAERVHHALDTGRGYRALWIVGVPDWHELEPAARAELEALDGVIVGPGRAQDYDGPPPLLVRNVAAADEQAARDLVAGIVGIEQPAALGVAASSRVFAKISA